MDITLHVVIDPPTHALPTAADEAYRMRRGDIINVYLSADCPESPNPNVRLGFVRITGVPDRFPFEKIKRNLIGPIVDESTEEPQRKFGWRIPPSILPASMRAALNRDREITVTWAQAKPYIRKKVVVQRDNRDLDDETTELADADIERTPTKPGV